MKHYKSLRYVLCIIIALNPLLVTYTHSMTIPIPAVIEAAKAVAVGLGGAACVEVGRQITNFARRHLYRDHERSTVATSPVQQSPPVPQRKQASISAQPVQQAPQVNFDSFPRLPFERQPSRLFADYSLQNIVRNAPLESAVSIPTSTSSTSSTPQATSCINSPASEVSISIPSNTTFVHALPQPTEHISAGSIVSMPVLPQVAAPDAKVRDLALRAAHVKARVAQAQAQVQSQVYAPTETITETSVQVPTQATFPAQTPARNQTSAATSVPAQVRVSSPEQPKIYWGEAAIRILAGAPAQTADQQCAASVPSEEVDIVDYQRDEQFDRYLERHPRKKVHYNQEVDNYISLLITVCNIRAPFVDRYRALLQVNGYRMAGSWGRHLNRLVRKLNRFYFDTTGTLQSFVQDKASLKAMEDLLLHFFAYASKSKQQFNNCIQFAQSKGILRHCRSQIRTMRDNLRYYNDRISLVISYGDALNGASQSRVTGNIQNEFYREFARYAAINPQLSLQALVENAARAEQIFIEQQYAFPKSLTTQQMHTELTQLYHYIGNLFSQNKEQCSASAPIAGHPHAANPEGTCEPGRTSTQQIPGAPPLDIKLPPANVDIPEIKIPDHTCGTPATPDLPKDLGPDTINPGENIKPRPCNYSQMSDMPQLEVPPQVTDHMPQPDPDQDGAGITPEQIPQVQALPVTTDIEGDEKYIEEEIERILNEGIAVVEDIKKRFADNSAFLPDNIPADVREKLKRQFLDSMLREIALAEERILENALQVGKQLAIKEFKDKQTIAPSFLDQYLPVTPHCLREIQEVLQEKLNELIKGNIACINHAKQQALARGKPYIGKEGEGLHIEETNTVITIIDAVGKVIERYRKLETGEWCRYFIPDKCQDEIDAWAEHMYSIFRNRNDIDTIAKNTGLPKHWIKFIKDHIFYNDHILFEEIGKFHANPEMASAWERLYQGDFIVNDIRLLEHEYFELKIEKWGNLSYRAAHKIVQQPKGRPWFDPKYLYYD